VVRAWLTPDNDPAGGVRCWRVFCPDGDEWEAALRGALALLAMPNNWEEHGSVTPDVAAQRWVDANYRTYKMSVCMPVGSIFAYAGSSTPDHTMDCDGRSLDRDEYQSLFAAIGTVFGAPDSDHFNIPNIGGRFIAGTSSGGGYSVGDTGGQDAVTLDVSEVPPHDHGIHGHLTGLAQLGAGTAVNTPSLGGDTDNTGGGDAHENRPPFIALRWLIVVR
jgi:microcystin-dependent protein